MDKTQREAGAAAASFYDALRSGSVSSAALGYGGDFVGQECTLLPREMLIFARRAGVGAGTSVLDVGSGTGGPACFFAEQLGCQVLGVDVSAVGHERAVARAKEAGLDDRVQFRLGDIQDIDLPPDSFDVVITYDTWCHIPQRAALIQRCATLLKPGGRMAIFDHVERRPLPADRREHFFTVWHFPVLETPRSYAEALEAAGLRLTVRDVSSAYAARFYTRLVEGFTAQREEFEAIRGTERYLEGLDRLQMSQQYTTSGRLGQVAYIAEKASQQ